MCRVSSDAWITRPIEFVAYFTGFYACDRPAGGRGPLLSIDLSNLQAIGLSGISRIVGWDGGAVPAAQAGMIAYLISAGADPNAVDASGVTPLHRAVRTRSLAAVRALLDGGANPRQPNKSRSTPLHLAVQTTGKSGSGSDEAHQQQAEIITLLMERGARLTDRDGRGRRVDQAARSDWVRALLRDR